MHFLNHKTSLLSLSFLIAFAISSIAQSNYFFKPIPSEYSGLKFRDSIKPISLNLFNYPYYGNSAGIGVGDFNNDGLTDIFFSGNMVNNRLYLNKGDFKFRDVTEQCNIQGNNTWGTGVSVVDINGDGLLDIYVSHSGNYNFSDSDKLRNELFINQGMIDGVPRFKEEAKEYGLDLPGSQTTQAVFFDYDGDGDLDMFLLNHATSPYTILYDADKYHTDKKKNFADRLFRNDNGHFVDVSKQAGIIGSEVNYGLGVVICDLNNDGWPDIYCTSDFDERDFCYINQQNGTFKESLFQSFRHISKYSMGVDAADINNDLLPDIITVDMKPEDNYRQKTMITMDNEDQFSRTVNLGFFPQYSRNMLQLNLGVDISKMPQFSEIGQLAGISSTDWSWCPLLADFDNDGWKDLFITSGYIKDENLDILNNFVPGKRIRDSDLVLLKLQSHFFKNDTKGKFIKVTENWYESHYAASYAAAYADFNNDGALDLVICNLNEEPTLLKNIRAAKEGNFISIKLRGRGLNVFALGAKVILESNGHKQMQELEPVRGYQSSQDYTLHFGLGKEVYANVSVIWPDGSITAPKQVQANQILEIKEENTIVNTNFPKQKTGIYKEIELANQDSFISRQLEHPDFKYQFTLPYKVSDYGQVVAAGDINGDSLMDYYIGGEAAQDKFFMLGTNTGQFAKYNPGCFDLHDENSAAILFDADNDGDLDLLIVSRKVDQLNELQLYNKDTIFTYKLYENIKGTFHEVTDALPLLTTPSKVLAVADFDQDGYPDVFIGGYTLPLTFGKPSNSYILHNESGKGKIKFTDYSSKVLPTQKLGMITSAAWKDIDNDQFPELFLGGEWMSCKLLKNERGILKDYSLPSGLSEYTGLWSLVYPIDINNDGHMDLFAGNIGMNNQLNVDKDHPISLTLVNLDYNKAHKSRLIPVMGSYYSDNKQYPIYYRDEMLAASEKLRKVFPNYGSYAGTTLDSFLIKSGAMIDTVLHCNTIQSGLFINDGKDHFNFEPFSYFGQMSRISALAEVENNKSGLKDLFVGGNFNGYKLQIGVADALPILLFENKGKNDFETLLPSITGLFSTGQVSMISIYEYKGKKKLLVFRKNKPPQFFELSEK